MAGGPLDTGVHCRARSTSGFNVRSALNRVLWNARKFYSEKIRVLKASRLCLYTVAWNNGIGPRIYFVGFRSRGND